MEKNAYKCNLYFSLFGVATLLLYSSLIQSVVNISLSNDANSHIIFIPFVSIWLMYIDRGTIFRHIAPIDKKGVVLLGIGILLFFWLRLPDVDITQNDRASIGSLSLVLFIAGGFSFCYGITTLRAASFPILFLLFMVPLPEYFLDLIITILQKSSAEMVNLILQGARIPFFRDGEFTFQFAGLSIEVAKECSGIRSSWSLFIVSVLAGHLFLDNTKFKVLLSISVLPITIFKNALRITLLSMLSIYIDRGFLTGNLHRIGGMAFFAAAVFLLGLVLHFLKKTEHKTHIK